MASNKQITFRKGKGKMQGGEGRIQGTEIFF